MLTNRAIVDVIAETYTTGAPWDFLLDGDADDDGIYIGLRRIGNVDLIACRGSRTLEDWMRDSSAWSHDTCCHPRLGPLHAGFYAGLEEALANLERQVRHDAELAIAGHSLGAARAAILAGMFKDIGRRVDALSLCGCPRPGFQQFADWISDIPTQNYRNVARDGHGHDYVTDVPFTATLFPYVPAALYTDNLVTPAPHDKWGPFAFHHIELYQGAVVAE